VDAYEVSLWGLKNEGGSTTATIDLGRNRSFLAWADVTMIDSLDDFDSDNAVVAEVYQVDGMPTGVAVFGGDHWGAEGSSDNVHQGGYVGYGRRITFRLRSIHDSDLDSYGMGVVLALSSLRESRLSDT
jgi:hypothetical protein